MYLSNLEVGTTVNIKSMRGIEEAKFETVLRRLSKGYAFFEAIRYKGTLVDFSAESVKTVILLEINDLEYAVAANQLHVLYEDGIAYHVLPIFTELKLCNKRDTFRVEIGRPCTAQVGENRKAETAIVHNASFGGLGLISRSKPRLGDSVRVHMTAGVNSVPIVVTGKVVRVVEDDKNHNYFSGIQLDKENSKLNDYITLLQRNRLRVQGRRRAYV